MSNLHSKDNTPQSDRNQGAVFSNVNNISPLSGHKEEIRRAAEELQNAWITAAITCIHKRHNNLTYGQLNSQILREVLLAEIAKGSPSSPVESILGKKGDLQYILASIISRFHRVPQGAALKLLRQQFIDDLSSRAWTIIYHRISTDLHGRRVEVTDQTIPLNEEFHKTVDGASLFKGMGTKGRPSVASKYGRLVPEQLQQIPNAWQSCLYDQQGGKFFQAFRTGSLPSFGVQEKNRRIAAGMKATKLLLEAIVLSSFGELPLDRQNRIKRREEALTIKVASLDLQTWVSEGPRAKEFGIERQNIEEQREIWRELSAVKELTVRLQEEETTVDISLEVMFFNFPVHELVFTEGIGWEAEVNILNEENVAVLLSYARKSLLYFSGPKRDTIEFVLREINEILDSAAHRQPGFDPYKLNTRLGILAYQLGCVVHFNCRSGKDRTSFLDAEMKLYAIEVLFFLKNSSSPSTWNHELDPARRALLSQLLINGSGPVIQSLNSGAPGSKLNPIFGEPLEEDPLVSRVGVENWTIFKSLSEYSDL